MIYDIFTIGCWKDRRKEISKKAQNRMYNQERLRNNVSKVGVE